MTPDAKPCPLEVVEAIDRIVQYNWDKEEEDYNLCLQKGDEPRTHVYLDLVIVNNWLFINGVASVVA